MFTVIGIMFGGIAVGYLLRKVELLQKIGKPISYTILLLLFLLGISVGANDAIVDNLTTLGGQAFDRFGGNFRKCAGCLGRLPFLL